MPKATWAWVGCKRYLAELESQGVGGVGVAHAGAFVQDARRQKVYQIQRLGMHVVSSAETAESSPLEANRQFARGPS